MMCPKCCKEESGCGLSDCPVTNAEEVRRGELLAEVLQLKHGRGDDYGRYMTTWGSKTALGVFRTVKRIIEEGE